MAGAVSVCMCTLGDAFSSQLVLGSRVGQCLPWAARVLCFLSVVQTPLVP